MPEIDLSVSGVMIQRLRKHHISGVLRLMNAEGWYYYDHRELMRYLEMGEDCFALIRDGDIVGSIFSTNYGNQAWLGNIVVARSERGKGFAGHMIREAINHLRKERRVPTFRLGSVPLAIGLYKQLGFRPEAFTTAHEATLPLRLDVPISPDKGAEVEPLREIDLNAACDIDALIFKSRRDRLLRRLHRDSLPGSRVCLFKGGRVVGFLMIRRRLNSKTESGLSEGPEHAYRLGPCCVLPEYGINGFKMMFEKAIEAVHDEVRESCGTAKIYVVFPKNPVKKEILDDTKALSREMGIRATDQDLERVFDQHARLFEAPKSQKNEDQWKYMRSIGFHQEYFEQVMSFNPDEETGSAQRSIETSTSAADPEGIFASATPGDKA